MITEQSRKPPISTDALWSGRFDSEPESIKEVRALVGAALKRMGYSGRTLYLGITVASEMATNAYKHATVDGSGFVVRAYQSEVGPVMEVQDASTAVPEVRAVNFATESGRGLLLMKSFMDEVHYNEQGNEVTLVKLREQTGK